MKYAFPPFGIEHRGIVGLPVFVGVELSGVAEDIVVLPGLRGEEVVEEAAIEQQAAIEDQLIREFGLVLGHVGLGEIQPVRPRPDFDPLAGDGVQVVILRQVRSSPPY